MLKKIRVGVAALVWVSFILLFMNFFQGFGIFNCWLAKVQIVPALLAVNILVLVFWGVVTWLWGRIYCSVACPLGISQDIFSRLFGSKKRKFVYEAGNNKLRYVILIAYIASLSLGIHTIFTLLSPYATFARFASNVINPLSIFITRFLVASGMLFNFNLVRLDNLPVEFFACSLLSFCLSVIIMLAILLLAHFKGRWYCNNICPVGTALGFISFQSRIRINIEDDKCVKCGQCERRCKGACIDSANCVVDNSRCVVCFNCLDGCPKEAIHFSKGKIRER